MELLKRRFRRILPLLAIIGPGIIAGSVDNDAGGITTYSIAGANFGFSLLWVLLLSTVSLAVTQEIGARMGLATGKGLASLIREKFGIRWTTFVMGVLLLANLGVIAAEFAGIAASLEIFGVPRFVSVPIAAVLIFLLVTKGSFKTLEKIFLVASAFYIVYIISAYLAHPDWLKAIKSLAVPSFSFHRGYLLAFIATIGTTITPWGQFFIQDYVVDKKLSIDDLKIERGDVFFGSFLTNFISFFIIVACATTIFAAGKTIVDAKDAAFALQPLAGEFASTLFAFGLFNASIFGAALVPVSTAYVISEAFGFESGLNFNFKEAPMFYGIFSLSIILGALFVVLPIAPLISVLFLSQALNTILLIPIFVFIYFLSNDRKILNGFSNNKVINTIFILTFAAITTASLSYLLSLILNR